MSVQFSTMDQDSWDNMSDPQPISKKVGKVVGSVSLRDELTQVNNVPQHSPNGASNEVIFEQLREVRFTLEGITEYLMNNPAGMSVGPKRPGPKTVILPPNEEAESKVYRNHQGFLYVPATQVRASIVEGAKKFIVKGNTTLKGAAIAAISFEEMEFLLHDELGNPQTQYVVDTRYCRVGTAGIMRSRPMMPVPWYVSCHFTVDELLLPVRELENILNTAGKRCGIGDFRPEKGGYFGRFRLVRFESL